MMDVFDLVITPPAEPTLADRKAAAASNVKQMAVSFAASLINQRNEAFAHIWDSPKLYGLTPSQVCEALDTTAASIFKRDASFCGWVYQAVPQLLPLLRLPPSDATITYETDADGNETGRVTITRSE